MTVRLSVCLYLTNIYSLPLPLRLSLEESSPLLLFPLLLRALAERLAQRERIGEHDDNDDDNEDRD